MQIFCRQMCFGMRESGVFGKLLLGYKLEGLLRMRANGLFMRENDWAV